MTYTEYYKARDLITKIVSEDLLGPVDENEVLQESPVSYYLVGKIYPRNIKKIEDETVEIEDENLFSEDELIALGNEGYPSVMGITFALEKETTSFDVRVKLAYYVLQENVEEKNIENSKEDTKPKKLWERRTLDIKFTINLSELIENKQLQQPIHKDLFLHTSIFNSKNLESHKLTVAIVNNSVSPDKSYDELSKLTYFQAELEVCNPINGSFCELFYKHLGQNDAEAKELELLYTDVKNYAIGHGCAANWEADSQGNITRICIDIMPEHAVLQMKPSNCITGEFLSMKYLSEATYEQIAQGIELLCNNYQDWIFGLTSKINSLDNSLKKTAQQNIEKCQTCLERIRNSIDVLKDKMALKAFQYANKTMYLQRQTVVKDAAPYSITWYPFQLAFILLELASIVDPLIAERNLVDLLWFPTGGGKTEAYLGISAFTIFYRKMRGLSKGKEDEGVAVFMRYTLRLLSFQQFERASAMICAAEVIRRRENLGQKPFGIGLWVGRDLTPNQLKDAEDYQNGKTANNSNPVQVTKCPWCSSDLGANDYRVDQINKRMHIRCSSETCEFKSGLPIHLIDEEIYEHKPSFIIGTVDKFARIAFKQEAGELLGIDLEHPPELIIQDELHLISGPLGTITGIYETAIIKLCEKNGIRPKIIASTATIRNAESQIKALYAMGYEQFPPQGLTIADSYFAELSNREEKAERDYLGVFAPGSSVALSYTMLAASLLFACRYLIDAGFTEEVIDSFWTQTGYFNTLRELGSALTRVIDSVQDRFVFLKNTKFKSKYPFVSGKDSYDKTYEMTSRHSSIDLGNAIQNELSRTYKKDIDNGPYDFLLASNMISVGVDVPRLNNMLVVGQPLKTSEYIQATSRVGRKTPGLVYMLYHPAGSRDRSHYEQFKQYHQSLYKYVEATSLTPFADRARDRALQALYVILCRYLVPNLRTNQDAKNYSKTLPELNEIKKYIFSHVSLVDPQELENVKQEIEEIETLWDNRAKYASKLCYFNFKLDDDSLYKRDYNEGNRFRMMNSMRSVEPEIQVFIRE